MNAFSRRPALIASSALLLMTSAAVAQPSVDFETPPAPVPLAPLPAIPASTPLPAPAEPAVDSTIQRVFWQPIDPPSLPPRTEPPPPLAPPRPGVPSSDAGSPRPQTFEGVLDDLNNSSPPRSLPPAPRRDPTVPGTSELERLLREPQDRQQPTAPRLPSITLRGRIIPPGGGQALALLEVDGQRYIVHPGAKVQTQGLMLEIGKIEVYGVEVLVPERNQSFWVN